MVTSYPRVRGLRTVARRIVGAFDATVALDSSGASALTALGGADVSVIPTPVDLTDSPAPMGSGGRDVIYVGRLSAEKRPDLLIDAFAVANRIDPTLRLRVVGDGPERAKTQARAREAGVSEAVTFVGTIAHPQVRAELDRSAVLALSSDREGIPAAAVEAMAAGRPVVATAVGGLPDLVADGGGFTVPRRDATALGEAMIRATRTTWDARALRQRATAFAVERVAADYIDLYERLLSVERRKRAA